MSRLKVKIITGKSGFATTSFYAGTKVCLIGLLVFGKTDIAVNTEQAFFGTKAGNGRIRLLHGVNDQLNEVGKINPAGFILGPVGIKPGLVIVLF
jgi:hypothetical protein